MMFRKVFALLMTLVLMLGMAPVGHAEGGNMMPGGDFTVICNHNWEWHWPNGKPAHCQEWKRCEEYCTKCGAAGDSFEQCGPCQPGPKQWIRPQGSNCQEYGVWQIACKYCGEQLESGEEPGPHKYAEKVLEQPTCTGSGWKESSCIYCGSEQGGPVEIPALGHNWGPDKVDHPGNCLLPGLKSHMCTRCNTREEWETGYGSHSWGEWRTISYGDCLNPGREVRTCSVCGLEESRNASHGGHSFGEWEETQAPTCMAEGRRKHVCTRCGHTEWSNIPKVDHLFGAWYVVTPAQVGVAGLEQRDCTYGCGTYEQREIPPLKVVQPAVPSVKLPRVVLEKHVMNTPLNGEFFVPGEAIQFGLTLWVYGPGQTKASSEYIVKDITLYDPLKGKGDDEIVLIDPGTWNMGNCFYYTVTEEDAQRGYVTNTGYATWVYVENGQPGRVDSNTVTTPCGFDDSGDFGLTAGLSVTKKVTSTPANGSYYEPGEDITFVITVSNQGVGPLMNVNVIDPLGGGLVTVLETLNVGETRDITVVFTTTDIVAWAGSVDNGACVKAVDKDGRQYVEYSNIVTVPCGHTFLNVTITPPFGIFHSLAVVKKEESLPLNGQYYTEGEVIHYSITYTNDGELPLTDVQIWDVLNVTTPVASAEMLNPGESRVCYYQHTVTAEDVAAGSVMNVAHASYPVSNAAGFANSTSNVVISKTSAYHWVWVTPLFPEDATPEYDPGTGWFPIDPAPEGETPSFGTIDTDALHSGNNYCVRTITGRNNVSVSYETAFCSVHSPIQSSMLMMSQAAITPETQLQTASYAVALWRTELEKLYREIFEAADPVAKMVVMAEYTRFLNDIANYEAMLKLMYPDQPGQVAMKIAAMWENKCIDLCYDVHAAADERKDSLLAVTPTAGTAAAGCSCEVVSQAAGKKNEIQNYCPMHSFPFGMIDMLLQGKDTAESWGMVRQIWGVELTSAYNKLYAAMGDNKLLAMAEYEAMTQWMMAREAALIALYPDHPEIVAQIMVKTIMERVNALCQIVQ